MAVALDGCRAGWLPLPQYCAVFFSQYDRRQIKQTPYLCRTTSPNWGSYFSFEVHSMDELAKDMDFHVFDRSVFRWQLQEPFELAQLHVRRHLFNTVLYHMHGSDQYGDDGLIGSAKLSPEYIWQLNNAYAKSMEDEAGSKGFSRQDAVRV